MRTSPLFRSAVFMPQTIISYMVKTDGFELTSPHDRQGNLPSHLEAVRVAARLRADDHLSCAAVCHTEDVRRRNLLLFAFALDPVAGETIVWLVDSAFSS